MSAMSESMKLIVALIIVALIWTFTLAGVSNESPRVVSTEAIFSKIKMGLPVEYDHVAVIGDLTLSHIGLPNRHVDRTLSETNLGLSQNATVINSSIRMNDSEILGRVELSNLIFQKSVSFENTKFHDSADFKGSQFNELANFKGAQFGGFVDFRGSRFRGPAELDGTRFNKSVDFSGSQFTSTMPWSVESRFNETSEFLRWKLGEFSDFLRFKFKETTDFVSIQLIEFVDFIRSGYNEMAGLTESQLISFINAIGPIYNDTTAFLKSQLIEFAEFIGSNYYRTYSFINPYLDRFANFIRSEFNNTAQLAAFMFYNPVIMMRYLLACSAIAVMVFAFFWRAIGPRPSKTSREANSSSDGQSRKSSSHSGMTNEFLMLLRAFSFSAAVFLAGTKIFIDTPTIPELPGRARYLAAGMFALERMIGALISIFFFIAIIRL